MQEEVETWLNQSWGPVFKYGVEVPKSTKHAEELDAQHGNSLWKEAYHKDIASLLSLGCCNFRPTDSKPGPDYQFVKLTMIYEMVCKSTSLQKQAQFDTVSNKAFNLPLLPCLNAASSPAQKVVMLCTDFSRNAVLKQSTNGMLEIEILNHSLVEIEIKLRG